MEICDVMHKNALLNDSEIETLTKHCKAKQNRSKIQNPKLANTNLLLPNSINSIGFYQNSSIGSEKCSQFIFYFIFCSNYYFKTS
jgi:hypothetical protein